MITLHIFMGIPGAGKSTKIAKLKSHLDNVVIIGSDDEYRAQFGEFTGPIPHAVRSQFFGGIHEKIFSTLKDAIAAKESFDLIFDATNLNRKRRRVLFLDAHRIGVDHVKIHWVAAFPERAHVQNEQRTGDQVVPREYIERHFAGLNIPRKGVDCDSFIIHNNPISEDFAKRVQELEYFEPQAYSCEISWLKDSMTKRFLMQNVVPHDSRHHLESVDMHIDLVNEQACLLDSDNLTLRYAAFFHDLGKGQVKGKVELENQIGQFKSHDNVGAQFAMLALDKAGLLDDKRFADVPELVGKHMLAHTMGPRLSKATCKRHGLSEHFLDELTLLNKADERGRVLLGKELK